jgi:hypothetical protein
MCAKKWRLCTIATTRSMLMPYKFEDYCTSLKKYNKEAAEQGII